MTARHPFAIVLCAIIASGGIVSAHDSPEHEIEALTQKMRAAGPSAALLARRAVEWRSLRKLDHAREDLERAVLIEPDSVALRAELARIQAAQGSFDAALKTLESALAMAGAGIKRGPLYMQRAELREASGEHALAIEDCERAFRAARSGGASSVEPGVEPGVERPPPSGGASSVEPPDWYLTRARLFAQMGQWRQCAAGLKEGFEKSGSIVLEIEWIEALIDAGECEEALSRIQPRVAKARWKGGWLVREGRAYTALNRRNEAQRSLKSALRELEARLDAAKPEGQLLAERGLAHALLGNRPAAARDLAQSRLLLGEKAAFMSCIQRLDRVLGK